MLRSVSSLHHMLLVQQHRFINGGGLANLLSPLDRSRATRRRSVPERGGVQGPGARVGRRLRLLGPRRRRRHGERARLPGDPGGRARGAGAQLAGRLHGEPRPGPRRAQPAAHAPARLRGAHRRRGPDARRVRSSPPTGRSSPGCCPRATRSCSPGGSCTSRSTSASGPPCGSPASAARTRGSSASPTRSSAPPRPSPTTCSPRRLGSTPPPCRGSRRSSPPRSNSTRIRYVPGCQSICVIVS
ncbi:hypothetical protein PVAP13_1NG061800 [Panicum virgatum]|uniref:Uncharacterized protein n=1 Tax=Panicum virgatum TaxID=38727 RepID=A0A8T0WV62_PANVG|nr:hypothetical protein PVAP13_1NG061800 [Panicum virgatum]